MQFAKKKVQVLELIQMDLLDKDEDRLFYNQQPNKIAN
jgi:hypothetical protein